MKIYAILSSYYFYNDWDDLAEQENIIGYYKTEELAKARIKELPNIGVSYHVKEIEVKE